MPGSAWRLRPTAERCGWAADRKRRSSNSRFDENGQLAARAHVRIGQRRRIATAHDFIGDVAVSPDGRLLYAADLYHDSDPGGESAVRHADREVQDRPPPVPHPVSARMARSFYVTSWADGSLVQHQTSNGAQLQTVRLGAHPTDMVWRDRASAVGSRRRARRWKARIFVAAANTNNVYAVGGVGQRRTANGGDPSTSSTSPMHPLGMTPSALALSPDQNRLYVVCSDANAAAVVDVTEERSHVLGFIPTGWYPTAVKALADGRLVVLNGKGSRSYPNPERAESVETQSQESGRRTHGSVRGRPCRPARHRSFRRSPKQHSRPTRPTWCAIRRTRTRSMEAGPDGIPAGDRARDLHRQGESHLRSGAGRHRQGRQRSVAMSVRRKGRDRTITSWRASSCCSTTFT